MKKQNNLKLLIAIVAIVLLLSIITVVVIQTGVFEECKRKYNECNGKCDDSSLLESICKGACTTAYELCKDTNN